MISPFFRRFTAVFMAILFAVFSVTFPITASAVVDPITASIVGISAAVAIPAILGGLGFFPTPDNSSVFDSLVTTIADALSPAWEVASTVGGTFLQMLSLNGNIYAQKELVQEILDFLFESSVVSTSISANLVYACNKGSDATSSYSSLSSSDSTLQLTVSRARGKYPELFSKCRYLYCYNYINQSYYAFTQDIAHTVGIKTITFVSDAVVSPVISGGVAFLEYAGQEHGPSYRFYELSSAYTATAGLTLGAVAADLADEAYRTWVQSPIIVISDPISVPDPSSPSDPTDPSEDTDTDTDIAPTTPPGELETPGENNSKYLGLFKYTPDGVRWDEYIMAALAGQITGLGLQTMLQTREPQIQLQDQVDIIDTGNRVQIQTDSVPPDIELDTPDQPDTDPDTDTPTDPQTDYLTQKVLALRARFPFVDSIIGTAALIRDSISADTGPPVIYVDLSLAPSGNYGDKKVLLTDFAWYAKYKPSVDSLLSAVLWAFFAWRVFLRLPGIISGESGYVGTFLSRREDETPLSSDTRISRK